MWLEHSVNLANCCLLCMSMQIYDSLFFVYSVENTIWMYTYPLFICIFWKMEILWYMGGVYLVLINIVAFVVRGIDKWKADNHKWRIRETTLLKLTGAGWFIGAMIGMNMFRHKTIKWAFLRWFMLIVFIRVMISAIFVYLWWGQ